MSSDDDYSFYTENGARFGALVVYQAELAYRLKVPIEDILAALDMAVDRAELWEDAERAVKQ